MARSNSMRKNFSCHQMTDGSRRTSELESLGCCQDLFRYYEEKFEKYECDYSVLDKRLEEYKFAFQDYYRLEMQLCQRDEEISSLQQALSDLQVAFVDEKAKANKYEVENKILRIHESDLTKRLQHFMHPPSENGLEEEKELHACCNYDHCSELMKQIRILKEQIEINLTINGEQRDMFVTDRKIRIQETEAAQRRDAHQIKSLTIKLKKMQEMLHDSTKEYFNLHRHFLAVDKQKLAQKNMKCYTDGHEKSPCVPCAHNYCVPRDPPAPPSVVLERRHKAPTKLRQTQPKCSYTRCNRNVSCERPREDVQTELDRWKRKFEALETRRQLEINGFQNDIKLLRNQLNSIEKQLFKFYDNRNSEKDGAVLRVIHQTETRSKNISNCVRDIKRQIYTMENELRSI